MNNQKLIGSIISLIASLGIGLFFCLIHNWSVNQSYLEFSSWEIIWLFLISINGATFSYVRENDSLNQLFTKTFFILIGLFFVVSGIDIIHREEIYLRAITLRGKAAVYWGILEILLGLALIVVIITVKNNISNFGQRNYVICGKCLESACRQEQGNTCQKCGGALEDLGGFYDRHPELRDRK